MRQRAEPYLILSIAALVTVVAALVVLHFALQHPWMGLSLAPRGEQIIVLRAEGPARALAAGTGVKSLSGDGRTILLEPLDLTSEPDGAMGDYATYRRFLDRQGTLSHILRADVVQVTTVDGETFTLTPDVRRPLRSLPLAFWVQLTVGTLAWLIAASVFAFRKTEPAARFLLLSGAATLVFSSFAGVYSTRELALPAILFQWLSDLNFLGGSVFAGCFVALLLCYPRPLGLSRIRPGWLGIAVVALFVGWFIAQQLGVFESMTFARRFLVMVGIFTTFALAAWHWFTSRRNPATRAALQWFLLSWVLGTGLFALFILLPQLFGIDTSALQGYAFLLFLLVYGGLAFGILRYRLFDLDRWWAAALLWLLAALLLIGLDFLFLFVLHLSAEMSLALALLICGVAWLPLRGLIWRRLSGRRPDTRLALFHQVTDVALAPPGADRLVRWQALLSAAFRPLHIDVRADATNIALHDEGLALLIPGTDGLPGLKLTCAQGGRRLFGPRDTALAQELVDMLTTAADSRGSYERGVTEERTRIARDIHDNIGARLMTALHSPTPTLKDSVIRETLTDLRSIINDSAATPGGWQEALADLRQETAERLHAAGLDLDWRQDTDISPALAVHLLHTLRSVVREAITNTLRHADASIVQIHISDHHGRLALSIRDNGQGLCGSPPPEGNGLANIRSRVDAVAGRITVTDRAPGLRLDIEIPWQIMPP